MCVYDRKLVALLFLDDIEAYTNFQITSGWVIYTLVGIVGNDMSKPTYRLPCEEMLLFAV